MFKWSVLILIGASLASCGSKEENTPVGNTVHLSNDQELRDAIASSTVYCMESDCPDNVGKLLFWSPSSDDDGFDFSVCSGTLISRNRFLTNRHCIPEDLQTGSNCSNRMMVQFPSDYKKRRDSENVNCVAVEKVYDNLEGEPDAAVLRIETSNYDRERVFLRKNALVPTDGKVHAYTMNPGKGGDTFSGYIYKKECTVSEQSILTGYVNSSSSDVVMYGYNCNVISGNSGSGLFNTNGDLIGIVHSKIDKETIKDTFSTADIEYVTLSYMGIAVNIGCVDHLFGHSSSLDCVNSEIRTGREIDHFVDVVKSRNSLSSYSDRELKAYIDKGLKLVISMGYTNYSYYRKNLRKMRSGLMRIFDSQASAEANSKVEYVWATLK